MLNGGQFKIDAAKCSGSSGSDRAICKEAAELSNAPGAAYADENALASAVELKISYSKVDILAAFERILRGAAAPPAAATSSSAELEELRRDVKSINAAIAQAVKIPASRPSNMDESRAASHYSADVDTSKMIPWGELTDGIKRGLVNAGYNEASYKTIYNKLQGESVAPWITFGIAASFSFPTGLREDTPPGVTTPSGGQRTPSSIAPEYECRTYGVCANGGRPGQSSSSFWGGAAFELEGAFNLMKIANKTSSNFVGLGVGGRWIRYYGEKSAGTAGNFGAQPPNVESWHLLFSLTYARYFKKWYTGASLRTGISWVWATDGGSVDYLQTQYAGTIKAPEFSYSSLLLGGRAFLGWRAHRKIALEASVFVDGDIQAAGSKRAQYSLGKSAGTSESRITVSQNIGAGMRLVFSY